MWQWQVEGTRQPPTCGHFGVICSSSRHKKVSSSVTYIVTQGRNISHETPSKGLSFLIKRKEAKHSSLESKTVFRPASTFEVVLYFSSLHFWAYLVTTVDQTMKAMPHILGSAALSLVECRFNPPCTLSPHPFCRGSIREWCDNQVLATWALSPSNSNEQTSRTLNLDHLVKFSEFKSNASSSTVLR